MRTFIFIAACLLSLASVAQQREYVPGHLMVNFKKNVRHLSQPGDLPRFDIGNVDAINIMYGCYRIHPLRHMKDSYGGAYLLYFPDSVNIPALMAEYESTGLFSTIEPDHVATCGAVAPPDDTLFSKQWSLYNDGSFTAGAKAGADIDILDAWTVEDGDTGVIVAILDTGVKPDHADLKGRIWRNLQEIPGNGIDDDNNGYADDTLGWNFAYGGGNIADDNGHGTNVTGIIGANVNNTTGYAGVDQHCKLMICKAADNVGFLAYSWMTEAIYYAVDNGANVINISAGGNVSSNIVKDALDEAYSKNVVVCAAMMNAGTSTPFYPAAYSTVIGVGATGPSDTTMYFSCYGKHISVVAPGSNIYGLSYQSDTATNMVYSGTSQATPHVAGIAALLLAQDKTRNAAQVRALIENNAEDRVGTGKDSLGWDRYYGYGRVNAYRSLTNAATHIMPVTVTKNISLFPNPASGMVYIHTSQGYTGTLIIYNMAGSVVYTAAISNGLHAVNLQAFTPGNYIVTLQNNMAKETIRLVVQ